MEYQSPKPGIHIHWWYKIFTSLLGKFKTIIYKLRMIVKTDISLGRSKLNMAKNDTVSLRV